MPHVDPKALTWKGMLQTPDSSPSASTASAHMALLLHCSVATGPDPARRTHAVNSKAPMQGVVMGACRRRGRKSSLLQPPLWLFPGPAQASVQALCAPHPPGAHTAHTARACERRAAVHEQLHHGRREPAADHGHHQRALVRRLQTHTPSAARSSDMRVHARGPIRRRCQRDQGMGTNNGRLAKQSGKAAGLTRRP